MKVVFTKAFKKEYEQLSDKKLSKAIALIVEEVLVAKSIGEISNIRKMEGGKNAYRVRAGRYRVGLFIEKDTAIFAVFEHRSSIYRNFP